MDINLEKYRVFYRAAQLGSLTKAAEALHISQPAVSQTIRSLEQQMGVELFERMPKGVRLTADGETLYAYVEQAVTLLKLGEERLTSAKRGGQLSVSVGASDTMSKYVLIPLLEAYLALHPDVQVRISNRSRNENMQLLREGKLDFCIWNMREAEEGLESVELFRVRDCFVAGSRFEELRGRTVTLQELARYPLIMQFPDTYARRVTDSFLYANGIELEPIVEFGNIQLLAECALIGVGIACVTERFVADFLTRGELFVLRTEQRLPERAIAVQYPSQWPLSPQARQLVELIAGSV